MPKVVRYDHTDIHRAKTSELKYYGSSGVLPDENGGADAARTYWTLRELLATSASDVKGGNARSGHLTSHKYSYDPMVIKIHSLRAFTTI